MGRPREPLKTKWAGWKRNQRDKSLNGRRCYKCSKPAVLWHHRNHEPTDNRPSNVVPCCKSHNVLAG